MTESVRNVDQGRRRLVGLLAGAGAGAAVFGRALSALAAGGAKVTAEMVKQAEWISGVAFTDEERALMLEDLNETADGIAALREVALDNAVPPAFTFAPIAGRAEAGAGRRRPRPPARAPRRETVFGRRARLRDRPRPRPAPPGEEGLLDGADEALPRAPREVRPGPLVRRDRDVGARPGAGEAGRRGARRREGPRPAPRHPVGREGPDRRSRLPGRPGAPCRSRTRRGPRPRRSTAGSRRRAPSSSPRPPSASWRGATSGSAGRRRTRGSSTRARAAPRPARRRRRRPGSSASPSGRRRSGASSLPARAAASRACGPTFGRVSRHGVMALAWTMDKVGPIARSAEDCALVFSAIEGRDALDPYSADGPFAWPPRRSLADLTIGFVEELFEEERGKDAKTEEEKARAAEWRQFDRRSLDVLRQLGARLVPLKLPSKTPVGPLSLILTAEAATAFDGARPRRPREDDGAADGGRLAERLPPGAAHPGRRLPERPAGPDPADARDGREPRRASTSSWRRRSAGAPSS